MTTPWEPSVLDQGPALDRLDNEVMNFEYFIAPTPAEVEARRWILQTIRKIFEEPYPGTKVVPFGSYKTGLALPNSDIDINIEIERSPNQTIKWLRRELVARGVCRQYDMETNRFKKGSVLKIFVPSKQVAADVTINNEIDSSMQTSQWIARYPKLKPLFLVLKHALSSIKYGNTNFQVMQSAFGGLAGYALICLIVHYLQLFDPNGNKLLSVLLMGFLKYYSELDLENQAITVGVEHMTTKDPKMQRKTLVVYENEQSTDVNIARSMGQVNKMQECFAFLHDRLERAVYSSKDARYSIIDAIVTYAVPPGKPLPRYESSNYQILPLYLNNLVVAGNSQPNNRPPRHRHGNNRQSRDNNRNNRTRQSDNPRQRPRMHRVGIMRTVPY